MPGQSVTLSEALPRSHYFVTISRGSVMWTLAIRTTVVRVACVIVPILVFGGLSGGLYLAFHDDLVAGLLYRQRALQAAYEARIDGLEQDLERQREAARSEQAAVDTRLGDLATRQAQLETRAAQVAELAAEGGAGARTRAAATPLPPEILGRPATLPPISALGYAATPKPQPLPEPSGSVPALPESHAMLLGDPNLPAATRLDDAKLALDAMERRQQGAVTRLGDLARSRVARLRGLFAETGLSADRYLGHTGATGGPFVPLPNDEASAFDRALAEARGSLALAAQLRGALDRVPLSVPLDGRMEVTSPFGARLDPFLGRPALHTGVDLREDRGGAIHATAAGRVTVAGPMGGYGNMVEVDHGNGVSTRYAHMEGFNVSVGQLVTRDTVLGFVGSTGRATGPHLHYEVRIDGNPVDPMRFLDIADRPETAALVAAR